MADLAGKKILHYDIIEQIGQGGMGVVYKAYDTKLDRTIALKFLPGQLSQGTEEKQRFIREAKAASALDHNNICTIHQIEETTDGQMFIAMAYYQGQSLKQKIESNLLPLDEVLEIASQVAEGLNRAHEENIMHRDIKPANIMITDRGEVKLVDFGLAKFSDRTQLTKEGATLGTVAYMSPEQTQGTEVDGRTDIWALGVIMYEMLCAEQPFKGDYEQAVMYSILNENPLPLSKVTPSVPKELEQIVNRCLQKNPEARFASAAELLKDLRAYQNSLGSAQMSAVNLPTLLLHLRKQRIAIPAVILGLFIIIISAWFFNRQAKISWAREELLPEIRQMVENSWRDFSAAYELAEQAHEYIGDDPELSALISKSSLTINIKTEPPGARVYIKNYKTPQSGWRYLGVSPIDSIRVAVGIFRWKLELPGYETVLAAASSWDLDIVGKDLLIPNDFMRVLDKQGSIPPGMVRVAGAQTPMGTLEDFFIDRYEVTNKAFKKFIDNGGYKKREYWTHEFKYKGQVFNWQQAMAKFVDQTGLTGPANWQAGDYPEGQDNYPVSGISWYEAAAYSAFIGKSIPTGQHWGLARGEHTSLIKYPTQGGFAVLAPFSNFAGVGPIEAGSLPGITPFGAIDMAGNVREWCWNETSSGRLVRGGAWDDNSYRFAEFAAAPAFNRSSKNGFRCALYKDPEKIPESVFALTSYGENRNYYQEKPLSDAIFKIYKDQFSYDKISLNVRTESRDESAEDWITERVTFDAAYGNERLIAHLFLPKNTVPPYQTVIYFPGSGSLFHPSSADITNYFEFPVFLSFLLKNGRAVLYPVYEGTFERQLSEDLLYPEKYSHLFTESLIHVVKDFKRSIDFLESRTDIDSQKLAYYGLSWGGVLGAIIPAIEERLQASIILAGGFREVGRPEAHQISYVSRVKIPTLMLNGRYDTRFPYQTSIKPMFDLLGTADEHKELKLYDTDHIPPKNEYIREILVWLDRYLGPPK